MSGKTRSAEVLPAEHDALPLGLFALALSVALTGLMFLARTGLPTPIAAVVVGPAIVAAALFPPLLWAQSRWVGPLVALGLWIGTGIAALGTAGLVIVWAVALVGLALAVRRQLQAGTGGLWAWMLLLIAAAVLAALLIHGSKYTNFVADQLLLYGRTDGDMMFHSAIANAFRYFHFPSTGIDGLEPLRYHTGIDLLSALIARGSDIQALLALAILRAQILFPLGFFALTWAAQVFGALLLPGRRIGGAGLAAATVIVLLLIASGDVGGYGVQNDPMFLSGMLLALVTPAIFTAIAPGGSGRGWDALIAAIAIIAVPVLSFTKISTGYFWCGLAGYSLLRREGISSWRFWVFGTLLALVFIGSYLALTDPAASGAKLFGTPFYVSTGFREGLYLLPLTVQAELLLALLALALWRSSLNPAPRRFLIETLVVAAVIGNLPGLLMDIPGSDAVFFILIANWFAAPILIARLATMPQLLQAATPGQRKTAWAAAAVLLLALLVSAGARTDDRARTIIAGAALLHTGDMSYYAKDKPRAWKADTQRALKEHGLTGLYALPAPEPVAAGLAAALIAFKAETGATGAAYLPPQSDFWPLVSDCDGRSLWPMAVSGVPLIDGYVPVQSACGQTFALIGYPAPPEQRSDLDDAALCTRAKASGFSAVLRIETLADRSKDRRIDCR